MLKTSYCFLITAFFLLQGPLTEAHIFRVVIDPGHGGPDEGTVYRQGRFKIAEKTVTLNLALQVAYQLRAKGILATLTRNEDQELSLPARTALANRLGADVFISIHMNSTGDGTSRDAEGIETYILNHATDASSRRLAHLENSVITSHLPNSPAQFDVALILKDLRLDGNLAESKRLACNVQNKLVLSTSKVLPGAHRNRGIKQALFHVLLGADMPSILVEAGFLSSPHDRSLVLSRLGQINISHAIADAIARYKYTRGSTQDLRMLNRCKIN